MTIALWMTAAAVAVSQPPVSDTQQGASAPAVAASPVSTPPVSVPPVSIPTAQNGSEPASDMTVPPPVVSTTKDAKPAAVSPAAASDVTPPATQPGDIVVTGSANDRKDPARAINQASFEAVQAVDQAIIEPVAHGYRDNVPRSARKGVHNFVNNLDEPVVFVNFLLQHNPGKAAETAARFLINSTLGLLGVMDVAKKKPFNLPRRSNGIADTLGFYGVGPGPYFFLPVIGPTTVRDGLGRMVDLSILPLAVGGIFKNPAFTLSKGALSALDERVEFDADLKEVRESDDPYRAARDRYLSRRKADIEALKYNRQPIVDPDRGVPPAAPKGDVVAPETSAASTPVSAPALPEASPQQPAAPPPVLTQPGATGSMATPQPVTP